MTLSALAHAELLEASQSIVNGTASSHIVTVGEAQITLTRGAPLLGEHEAIEPYPEIALPPTSGRNTWLD